ncbi:MAG: DUF3015 family protein [Oryzomonas sp.]
MFQVTSFPMRVVVAGSLMALVSSCAVTTDSTKGTSETLQNTSEASTNFTSSTSPRDEGKTSDAQNVKRFASVNLDRLREDMARGSGEHLTAFAHLLGVRENRQAEFFAVTKQNYPILFGSEPTTSDEMLARLDTELAANPAWRQ